MLRSRDSRVRCAPDFRRLPSSRHYFGGHMQRFRVGLIAVTLLFACGAAAFAQEASGIAGTARDASGAVVPGVTVEASSPVLIEKVRTVITDAEGRYNIVDLPPGTYTV